MRLLKPVEGQKDLWYLLSNSTTGKCDGCGAGGPAHKIRGKNVYLCDKCTTKREYTGEILRSAGHLQIIRIETSLEEFNTCIAKKVFPPHTVLMDEGLGGENDLKSIEQVCDQLLRGLFRKEADEEARSLAPLLDDDDIKLNHAVVQEYRQERTLAMNRVMGPVVLGSIGLVAIGAVGVGVYAILHPLTALFFGVAGVIVVGKGVNAFLKKRYRL